jgi:hypothetical protein
MEQVTGLNVPFSLSLRFPSIPCDQAVSAGIFGAALPASAIKLPFYPLLMEELCTKYYKNKRQRFANSSSPLGHPRFRGFSFPES